MSQYNQILLFYNQLLYMADEVKGMIEKELFDDIITKMEYHEKIVTQIRLIKRCTEFTEEEQAEINKFEAGIKEKEKENIEFIQNNIIDVKKELDRMKIKDKLSNAYTQDTTQREQGSIIDIEDTYRG